MQKCEGGAPGPQTAKFAVCSESIRSALLNERAQIDFKEHKIDIFALFNLQKARTSDYRSSPIKSICVLYCRSFSTLAKERIIFTTTSKRTQFDLKNLSSMRNFQT